MLWHRSSKRLLLERHLADFARLTLHPLHYRWQLSGEPAFSTLIKRFLCLVENRIPYQSSPLDEVPCHKSNHKMELLDRPASEISGKVPLSSSVSEVVNYASAHVDDSSLASCKKKSDFSAIKGEPDSLYLVKKETGSHEDAFLDLALAESGMISAKTFELRKNDIDGRKFLKSGLFVIHPCKAFSQIIKKGFHSLPEEVSIVDSRLSSLSKMEERQETDDGKFKGNARVVPQKDTVGCKEEQVLKPSSDNTESIETGLHREDKEAVMSQVVFVKDATYVLDGKNEEEKCNDLFSFDDGDIALKIAASSTKMVGRVSRLCDRRYFTLLEKKKKNKRERKKRMNWNEDRQLGPDDSKHLAPAPSLDQIAVTGTGSYSEKSSMYGKSSIAFPADLPNSIMIMSRIITPVIPQEFSGHLGLAQANVPKMVNEEIYSNSNSLDQAVNKQVICIEQLEQEAVCEDSGLEEEFIRKKNTEPLKASLCEESALEWKKVFKDFSASGEVPMGNRQKSVEMEPKMHKGRDIIEMIGKGKGACNEDAISFNQNRGKMFAYDDFKASTSSDSFLKGWMSPQLKTTEKGVNGDLCHHAVTSKVHYPLKNINLKELHVILDLNGVLIKRWTLNPSLPGVSKLNKRWIQLRPGCIEFLCKALSKFKVGIWSTMTQKNVLGVCKILEQQAHQPLPFFMLWSKDSCYQHRGVQRPDKSHVLADFKPLSQVWGFFEPYLGFHNTVLIDDSPYKACMNNPYNCIFPDAFEGCTDDDFLNDMLWPYLEKMRMAQNIQAYIANNPLGQQPIVVGHKLYHHVQRVMDVFDNHIHPTGTCELSRKVKH